MTGKSKLIVDPSQVGAIAAALQKTDWIGVDTEFIRETTFFPKIALIQLATDQESWLLDPTVLTKEDLKPVLDVLVDPKITKIFHAAFADQECFYWCYGVLAKPVLDTSVAAALCGLGDNAGLAKLLREIMQLHVAKGRARAKWLARPLSQELLTYAEQDVAHLVELGRRLKVMLEKKNRLEWAFEESELEPSAFDLSAEEMASKMGRNSHADMNQYPVLVELVRWREHRARTGNIPRNWVADNETLIAMARVRPRSVGELKSFRGLHVREVEKSGQAILEAIQRGAKEKPPAVTPRTSVILSESEEHVVDFIQTYVGYLAARHEIAPRYLLNTMRATRLLKNKRNPPESWIKEGILSQRAFDLIGSDLVELLHGHRALVLRNGEVQIVAVGENAPSI